MNLDELRAAAQRSAQQLREQGASLTNASQGVRQEGRSVLGVLGSHRSAAPIGVAINAAAEALDNAAAHYEQAASAVDTWISSNF
jgi:hypothetical protein